VAKNHKHSVNNPYSQSRVGYDEAAVLASSQISHELTKLISLCSPTSVQPPIAWPIAKLLDHVLG
jgi:hypothetical protein